MKILTVYTPTFNRAHLLKRAYDALCRQTSTNFEWLIIDDGSTDGTDTLVEKWINEEKIFIRYFYKENGGLHTAYNKAIEYLNTELAVCIDSDDFMPDNGVEVIIDHWKKFGSDEYAGILGYDFPIGKDLPLGGELPNVKELRIVDLKNKYNHYGDVKMIHRTDLLKKVFPMPTFKGEKNFNPIYLFMKIDKNYPLLLLRENLCFVEYQADGMTANIFNQYWNSPNSFAELRRLFMTHPLVPMKYIFRQNIHYVADSIIAKKWNFVATSPRKVLTILSIPLGIILYFYIRKKKTI
ncbi:MULTISPECIES: glycosyltransferase family 2 protein [unclassified Kaistella]|uniref:glycosyltransferase family 2 protein n=1 Tax=unclassified Kaistella TaxID=2762626 RepID=UPI00273523D0|nr:MULTISPECIES: glycosyltransferase family 2 protein [unclassified Kaistella]MDP2452514.1 glycosyltransferase family 2 protein [Kaistella sp. SH11-4b]MDP2455422.1 glycosyltransferase family 2 protein [Kaistella sp. SH40-3]MDP2458326.1 glycosyltransferase family 2 protein [Kaistella sp. SH19-2b]